MYILISSAIDTLASLIYADLKPMSGWFLKYFELIKREGCWWIKGGACMDKKN